MSKLIRFKPKKSLGQNFIFNITLLKEITKNIQPFIDKDTILVEIGSGYGSLTQFLLETKPLKLILIEKDLRLYDFLKEKFKEEENVTIINKDILLLDWKKCIFNQESNNKKLKFILVGNLPYNISNRLIINLLLELDKNTKLFFSKLLFLIQKEVAYKWVYEEKNINILSSFIHNYYSLEFKQIIPAKEFKPVPKVDGGLVFLDKKITKEENKENGYELWKFLKGCFLSPRKTLVNNLRNYNFKENKLRDFLIEENIEFKVRAHQLTLDKLKELYKFLKNTKKTTF